MVDGQIQPQEKVPSQLFKGDLLVHGAEGNIAPAWCIQMRHAAVEYHDPWNSSEGWKSAMGIFGKMPDGTLQWLLPKERLAQPEPGQEAEYHPLRAVDALNQDDLSDELKRELTSSAMRGLFACAVVLAWRMPRARPWNSASAEHDHSHV